MSGLSTAGTYTLEIRLVQPHPELLAVLAHPAFTPVTFDETGPRCSGPYEIRPGAETGAWRLEPRNVDRFPPIEVIGFETIEESFEAAKRGEVHIAPVPELAAAGSIGAPGHRSRRTSETTLLLFDATVLALPPPARAAMSRAVDRLALIDAVFGDRREPAVGWLPQLEESRGCGRAAPKTADAPGAAQALAETGVTPDRLTMRLMYNSALIPPLAAQAVQVQLKDALQIKAEPEPLDPASFGESLSTPGPGEAWLLRHSPAAPIVEESFFRLFLTGSPSNRNGFSDPGFDSAVETARSVAEDDRLRGLLQAEQRACELMPAVPLWHGISHWIADPLSVPEEAVSVDSGGALRIRSRAN